MSADPATRCLAENAVASRSAPLPAPAVDATVAALVDWCGVAVGGSTTTPAKALRAALATGHGASRLIGVPGRAEPATAALINGVAAHALELDDIYAAGTYHPGAPIIAAALAVADARGSGGRDLLRAIAIGYEIGNRVARTLGPAHYAYWHTTGTAGSVAAAAAVAELLALDAGPFAHALALASTMAAGLQQTFRADSMGKPLHSGHAAQNGVVAALSAAEGFTGTLDVLDGDIGMGVVMGDSPSWEAAREPFGPDFLIQQTTVKPYACCGHTFAAVDAALELSARGIRPEALASIDVETYAAALAVAGNPAPVTPFEAKFSIPFVVACALHDGHLPADVFNTAVLDKPEIRATMSLVALHDGAKFTAAFPARRGARVVATGKDGVRHEVAVPDRRGDPENPLSAEQLDAKFHSLAAGVLGTAQAGELAKAIRAVDELADVRDLPLCPASEP